MKLYPKKLSSLAALELEKKRVEKDLRQLEKEELFSLESILPKKKDSSEKGSGNILDTVLSYVPALTANPILGMAVQMIQKRMSQPSEKKQDKPRKAAQTNDSGAAEAKPKKNIIKTVALDILVSYLKWKAIELSYKGVRHIIKKRKEKKQRAQETV